MIIIYNLKKWWQMQRFPSPFQFIALLFLSPVMTGSPFVRWMEFDRDFIVTIRRFGLLLEFIPNTRGHLLVVGRDRMRTKPNFVYSIQHRSTGCWVLEGVSYILLLCLSFGSLQGLTPVRPSTAVIRGFQGQIPHNLFFTRFVSLYSGVGFQIRKLRTTVVK